MNHQTKPSIKVAFVGTVILEELCDKEVACSVAGNKYQLGVIKGLQAAIGQEIQVFSVWPIVMFPRSNEIFVSNKKFQANKILSTKFIPFINLPIIKQLTILFFLFLCLCKWLWQERNADERIVLVYNCFSPFSLSVLAATFLLGGKPIPIIADLPHNDYDFSGMIRGLLQRIDFYLQLQSITKFPAIISLTKWIAHDFVPTKPVLVVEGGIEEDDSKQLLRTPVFLNEKTILYSGALNDINGIELLINAFQLIQEPHYRLCVFGKGPMEPLIHEATKKDERVFYGGTLPNHLMKKQQAKADLLINPRPSHREITRYTFPSKILEYLASGRPVITTVLPGIPSDYYSYVFLLKEETPEGLANLINYVFSFSPLELNELGLRAREFVLKDKNWIQQGQRIYEFICSLETK